MLNQLSNAVALYLAPILSLTAVILALFSYLSPVVMLHTQVSLLVVKPSLLLSPNPSKDQIDGPTVFLGALGQFMGQMQAFGGPHPVFQDPAHERTTAHPSIAHSLCLTPATVRP